MMITQEKCLVCGEMVICKFGSKEKPICSTHSKEEIKKAEAKGAEHATLYTEDEHGVLAFFGTFTTAKDAWNRGDKINRDFRVYIGGERVYFDGKGNVLGFSRDRGVSDHEEPAPANSDKQPKAAVHLSEDKSDFEAALKDFIRHERRKTQMGSGDDLHYEQEVENYILSQKQFWLDAIGIFRAQGRSQTLAEVLKAFADLKNSLNWDLKTLDDYNASHLAEFERKLKEMEK